MRVLFASDHAGFDLKRLLTAHARSLGQEVIDVGPHSADAVDYPDLAHALSRRLLAGDGDRGVLVCGTGIGMSMAANRHAGIRAALCHDAFTADAARRHNNANVLCLGGRTTGPGVALQVLEIFLSAPFEGGRHGRRVEKIEPARAAASDDSDAPVTLSPKEQPR
jgi:ribose 5-phosphate isomerase B